MQDFETLSEAIGGLKKLGYTEDFNLQSNCLECQNGKYLIEPDDFKVDALYRFEGMSDPADSSILYAISSGKYGLKGILVDAYGTYAEEISNEMLQKLKIR